MSLREIAKAYKELQDDVNAVRKLETVVEIADQGFGQSHIVTFASNTSIVDKRIIPCDKLADEVMKSLLNCGSDEPFFNA